MKKKLFMFSILLCLLNIGYAQTYLRPKKSADTELYGYVNQSGKEVIPAKYQEAGYFDNDYAKVKFKGKWGVINPKGEVVIEFKYQKMGEVGKKYIAAKNKGKWGLLGKDGTVNPKVQGYDELYKSLRDDNEYHASKSGKWGMIDADGNVSIPLKYNQVIPCMLDYETYVVYLDDKVGLIKSNGSVIIPIKYSLDTLSRNGFTFDGDGAYYEEGAHFVLSNGEHIGVIDSYGEEIIPFKYDHIHLYNDRNDYGKFQLAVLTQGEEKTLVGKDLKPVIAIKFEDTRSFYGNNSNFLIIELADKRIFYDVDTKQLVDEIPESVQKTYGKYFKTRIDGKYGAIDYRGKTILPFEFEAINYINYMNKSDAKLFSVRQNDLVGVYKVGKGIVLPADYKRLQFLAAYDIGFLAVQNEEEKWALYTTAGEPLTIFFYDSMWYDYKKKKIVVKEKDEKGTLDENGVVFWEQKK